MGAAGMFGVTGDSGSERDAGVALVGVCGGMREPGCEVPVACMIRPTTAATPVSTINGTIIHSARRRRGSGFVEKELPLPSRSAPISPSNATAAELPPSGNVRAVSSTTTSSGCRSAVEYCAIALLRGFVCE